MPRTHFPVRDHTPNVEVVTLKDRLLISLSTTKKSKSFTCYHISYVIFREHRGYGSLSMTTIKTHTNTRIVKNISGKVLLVY